MKYPILLTVCFYLTISCSAQTGEAVIKYEPTDIKLHTSDIDLVLNGKGIVRLTFDNEDSLNVIKSEIVYLSVVGSDPNEKSFEYRIGRDLNNNDKRITFYKSELDSVFKNIEYEIVNENYKVFIPRADFPFVFKVYPLTNRDE